MAPRSAKKAKKASLIVYTSAQEVRLWSREQKKKGLRVAFVPTMVRLMNVMEETWATPRVCDHGRMQPCTEQTTLGLINA
jgi:hypothetical protein